MNYEFDQKLDTDHGVSLESDVMENAKLKFER